MPRYRTALGWRILAWIFMPALFGGGVALLVVPFTQDEFSWALVAFMVPMGLGLIGLCVYGIADLLISYASVDDQQITEKSPFGTRTLLLSEVKGVRQEDKYTVIVPKDPAKKKIKISTYVGKHGELLEWLNARFDDLNIVEVLKEQEQILANEEFGTTQEAREERLTEARRWAKYVNFAGIGAFIWALFIPQPYLVCVVINMAMPLVALVVVYFFRGLIRLDARQNSAYPAVMLALMMPGFGLVIRAVADFNVLEHGSIWKYVIMLTVTLGVLFYAAGSEIDLKKTKDKLTMGSLILMMIAYSYGTLILINGLFDKSEPQSFDVAVIDKEISSGKSTTYYLNLDAWGPRVEPEKVSVPQSDFELVQPGDTVRVHLHDGLLKTKWFYVIVE